MNFKYKTLMFVTLFIFCIGSVSAVPIGMEDYCNKNKITTLSLDNIQNLIEDNAILKEDNAKLKEYNKQLKEDNKQLKEDNKQLDKKASELLSEQYKLKMEIGITEQCIDSLLSDNKKLTNKLDKIESEKDLMYWVMDCQFDRVPKDDVKINRAMHIFINEYLKAEAENRDLKCENKQLLRENREQYYQIFNLAELNFGRTKNFELFFEEKENEIKALKKENEQYKEYNIQRDMEIQKLKRTIYKLKKANYKIKTKPINIHLF